MHVVVTPRSLCCCLRYLYIYRTVQSVLLHRVTRWKSTTCLRVSESGKGFETTALWRKCRIDLTGNASRAHSLFGAPGVICKWGWGTDSLSSSAHLFHMNECSYNSSRTESLPHQLTARNHQCRLCPCNVRHGHGSHKFRSQLQFLLFMVSASPFYSVMYWAWHPSISWQLRR
jgi:hypothetical protein